MTGWFCNECLDELTPEERHYYDDRCERCERAWADRVERWRRGGQDRELDDIYSEVRVVH